MNKTHRRATPPDHRDDTDSDARENTGRDGGFLSGLTRLFQSLSDLAEKGQEMKESGLFENQNGREGRFSYGVRFGNATRSGGGGDAYTPRTYANEHAHAAGDDGSGRSDASAGAVREPIVDVYENNDEGTIVVIAELPGVSAAELAMEILGTQLELSATSASGVRYRASVGLPSEVSERDARTTSNNGVVEIVLKLAG